MGKLRTYVLALALGGLVVLAAAWTLAPRADRFRSFDPHAVATAEAALWRAYYEHRYADLASGAVLGESRLFGFSPADSAQSGVAAANAARIFQRSNSRAEAKTALPELTRHFAVVARATRASFDPAEAARLELEWWQLRRETNTGPDAYAPAIAAATAALYQIDAGRLADYARLRAEAMNLRDQRGDAITEADWAEITTLLEQAYVRLRAATAP